MEPEKVKEKECRLCKSKIELTAKVCPHCQNYQNRFSNSILKISTFISIAFLIIAFWQLWEARQERVEASLAFQESKIAKEHVEKTAVDLRQTLKYVVENSYIQAMSGIGMRMGADPEAKEQLERNLDSLSRFIEPDSIKNKSWWDTLYQLYKGFN